MNIVSPKETDQYDNLIHNDSTLFSELTVFDRNNLAPVSIKEKFGLIDPNGKIAIPFEYEKIVLTTLNAYSALKGDKWGFVTKANQILIPFDYDLTSDFTENLCAVKKNKKWGFIDLLNQPVIPFSYDGCTDFKEGFAGVEKNGKWGIIDKNNRIAIDYQYEYLMPVNNKLVTYGISTEIMIEKIDILARFPYFLSKSNCIMHFGLISIENKTILEPVSELPILKFYEKQPIVRQNYQIGYLNNEGIFIKFNQFEIDPYEEKILKELGAMK